MQTITTPNGETLVVLPLDEYRKLVDQVDIATTDRIKADIAAGRDELIPEEIVKRLIDGENPIRVWRSYRGLSAKGLATKSGLSASFLSEIETGKKEGGLSTMKKIADTLAVTIDDLA